MRTGKTAPLRAGSFLLSSSRPFSLLSLSRGSRISSLRDRVSAHRAIADQMCAYSFFGSDAKRTSPLWTNALGNLTGAQRERIPCTHQL
jgi:hypothetical protein